MTSGAVVRGADLSLRHPESSDRDAFIAAAQRSRDLHRPWTAAPDSDEAFAAYLERSDRDRESCLLVTRNDDDALVGVYNVSEIVRGAFQNGYLGYYAFVPHAGHGSMRAAMPLVFEGFAPRYLHIDGSWRDHVMYAITAEEVPRRPP